MTIQAAIDMIDTLKPNMFPITQKVAWLSDLDGMIWREIILTHEGVAPGTTFDGYDMDTSTAVTLLAPEPYTDIYKHYMATKMDIANRETTEYAKDNVLFNSAWQTLCDYWNRKYMPISKVAQLRL